MAEHNTLTGSSLHENKGVDSAADNTVATATSGATVWKKLTSSNLDATSIFNTNKTYLQAVIQDISTAEDVYMAIPFTGTLNHVYTILGGTITGADSTITIKNSAGSSCGTITVSYSGSGVGDADGLSVSSNNTFTAGDKLLISNDGASTGTQKVWLSFVFTLTA